VRIHISEQTCTTIADAPAPPDPSARFEAFSRISFQLIFSGILAKNRLRFENWTLFTVFGHFLGFSLKFWIDFYVKFSQ
jgi:hypothetical protein